MLYFTYPRIAIVICISLWFSVTIEAQIQSVVADAYLESIDTEGKIGLRIVNVRNGELFPGRLNTSIRPDKFKQLYPGLRRFKSQKWLITLSSHDEGLSYELTSAYGLNKPSNEDSIILTIPLFTIPDKRDADHSRATTHTYEQEVVELTNQERWNNGMLPPFKRLDLLHNSSDSHSEAMGISNFFAHCNLSTGSTPGTRMQAAGYEYNSAAENIAAGYSSPSAVMAGWMSSSGHRANILSTSRRELGVGYEYNSNDGSNVRLDQDGNCSSDGTSGPFYRYWTQNFGLRSNIYPVVIERELAAVSVRTVDLYIYGPSNATSMRFSNDGNNWSGWVAYTPDYSWQLSQSDGIKTVYSQVSTGSNGSGTVYSANDQIELSGSCDPMVFSNVNLNGAQTYNSCEIIADPNVMISGDIIFQAGSVTLGQNVEVPTNATLEIQIQ